jgi:hypothetical protein
MLPNSGLQSAPRLWVICENALLCSNATIKWSRLIGTYVIELGKTLSRHDSTCMSGIYSSIVILALRHREKQRDQRIPSPVKQSRGETVMLR